MLYGSMQYDLKLEVIYTETSAKDAKGGNVVGLRNVYKY
jgi:hypothetical protein